VSSILAAQNDPTPQRAETVAAFNQRYERYTPLGLPQPRSDPR
jgi:hypothetical protein